jgi:hypothetical protein
VLKKEPKQPPLQAAVEKEKPKEKASLAVQKVLASGLASKFR